MTNKTDKTKEIAITPMSMLQIAVEQNADLDKLQKLMDLHERWEAGEAKKAFVAAMTAFKADPPEIFKNKHVEFTTNSGITSYDHASLDHISSAIGEKMSLHGLSFRWETEQLDGGTIKVSCVLTHIQGHSERVSLQCGADQSGGKNNIQAIGSTVTYLQRYTLLAAAGMATAEMDDDGKTSDPPEPITEEQVLILHSRATENEVLDNFKDWLKTKGIDALEDIPVDQLGQISKGLDAAIRGRKK